MDGWERVTYSLSRGFCAAALKTLNYRWKVYGEENMPGGRAIIAANHLSYLDPIFLGVVLGKLNFVARDLNPDKKPLNELFQQWLRLIGVITIDKEKPSKKDLERILDKLEKDNKVMIFPEGTRSIDGNLGTFNSGVALIAELSDSPVVPVAIKGTYEAWPKYGGVKYSRKVRINVCGPLYSNKEMQDKCVRREDLTKRIRNELEKGIYKLNSV